MIHNLFPTPIGFYELNREFTKAEYRPKYDVISRLRIGE